MLPQLEKIDHKSLRASCKDLSFAIDPLFFSSFVIETRHLHLEKSLYILTALATKQTGWCQYAKMLVIKPGEDIEEPEDLESMRVLLASALDSMKDIRTVK